MFYFIFWERRQLSSEYLFEEGAGVYATRTGSKNEEKKEESELPSGLEVIRPRSSKPPSPAMQKGQKFGRG